MFVAPGNAGTAADGRERRHRGRTTFPALIQFAKQNDVGLTVVGPEAPLADGIVDAFEADGLRVFGPARPPPSWRPARSSARTCSAHADVPSADYQTFTQRPATPMKYLNDREDVPIVVKADGLAAGKGVIVCRGRDEALAAVDQIARQKAFGDAGDRLVIEERLDGQEASVLAMTDGQTIVTLQPAQDHKPAYDGDTGPEHRRHGRLLPCPAGRRRDARTGSRSTCWCRPSTP